MVLVDVNPMGKVEDLHTEGRTACTVKALFLRSRSMDLLEDRGSEVEVRVANQEFSLDVRRVLGGNQWNVLKNLQFLKQHFYPNLNVQAHFGLGSESRVARKNLYLPDLFKVDLSMPKDAGNILFSRDLAGQRVMVSSAPFGEMGKLYWDGLKNSNVEGFYWNPGSKQIERTEGSLDEAGLKAMRGKVEIFQLNAEEAARFARNYGGPGACEKDLPEIVGAKWTVITEGAKGLRVYADGNVHEEGVCDESLAHEILGSRYVSAEEIGCGDATLAEWIALRESHPEISVADAAKIVAAVGSVQYHHMGANLSALV